uniref:Putative lectin/glucanase superfamily protein n=1 Tax=viral metagenome TaxID=1070528 RepID=A0A6M3JKG1_9ZZZZ
MIGITKNMWRKQNGLYSRMNFPTNGLQFYLPMWHPEQQGYALSYDGNDLLSNATANWRNGDTEGTFEQIFRSSSVANNQTLFASADTGTATSFLWIYVAQTTGKVTISTQDAAGTVNTVAGGTNICDGKDKYIVVTTNGSAWVIYINGVAESLSVGAGSNTGDWLGDITIRDNLTIGAITRTSTVNYAIGVNGYTRIYSRVMAAAEARTNYQRGHKAAASDATGLVFNLPCTEGTGNPVDTVGALTMTVTGATWIESLMDKSPNAIPCSAFGIPTWGVTGRTFGGNDSISLVNALAAMNSTTGAIFMWVKVPDATPVAPRCFFSVAISTAIFWLSFRISTVGELYADCYISGVGQWLLDTDAQVFGDDTWACIGLVQNGTEPVLYFNGTQPAQAFSISTNKTKWISHVSPTNGFIGKLYMNNVDNQLPLTGTVGETLVYNRVPTFAEYQHYYQTTKWRYL